MKTTLTDLLDAFAFPQEAEVAFKEALVCYRASAYRAALLFSYLGWGLVLRSRLLQASCPNGMQPGQWNQYQNELRNEDKWDARVFELTQMQNPAPAFVVAEDLRLQAKYWKDRRNDCAHFKKNDIGYAHVEAFWQFLKSSLGKFVPNGSRESLKNEICAHFDPNVTPPGLPVDSLVERIPLCVEHAELAAFFQDLEAVLAGASCGSLAFGSDNASVLFDAVFRNGDQSMVVALSAYLVGNLEVLLRFVRAYPQHVWVLNDKPDVVRQVWRQHLFASHQQDLPVYASMVRHDLIPAPELDEANAHVATKLQGAPLNAIDAGTLTQCGFFGALEREAFDVPRGIDQFGWGNRNAAFVAWYLATSPISEAAVRAICEVFATSPFPFTARDRLRDLFTQDAAKRQELENLAQQYGLTLPAEIAPDPPQNGNADESE